MGLLHHGGAELTPRAEDAEIIVSTPAASSTPPSRSRSTPSSRWSAQAAVRRQSPAHRRRRLPRGALPDESRRIFLKLTPSSARANSKPSSPPPAHPQRHANGNSPFNILPQGSPESTIHTTRSAWPDDGEVAQLESVSAQQLIDRAPSAVSQHSRRSQIRSTTAR